MIYDRVMTMSEWAFAMTKIVKASEFKAKGLALIDEIAASGD
jgi:hypothetical protein